LTTATNHNIPAGADITIAGMDPSGYNGTYAVLNVPTSNTLTYAKTVDPTTFVS